MFEYAEAIEYRKNVLNQLEQRFLKGEITKEFYETSCVLIKEQIAYLEE